MEFYVFRIRYQLDGTTKKSEIMTYDTLRAAEAKCHSNLGADMADATLSGGICMVISEEGLVILKTKWGEKVDPEAVEA